MIKRVVVAVSLLAATFAVAAPSDMITVGGKGKVSFVNTCDAPTNALALSMKKLGGILMINLEITKGSWSLAEAKKSYDAVGANVAIFIVKDKTLPMSLIAMESKWGVVNAEGLDDSGVAKEAMRVATVLLGAASSRFPASTMRPVFSADDLKKAGEVVTFDSIMAISEFLPSLGIERYEMMTREDAIANGLIKK